MSEIYKNMMYENDKPSNEEFSKVSPNVGQVAQRCGFTGLAAAVARMTPTMQEELLQLVTRFPILGSGTVSITNSAVKAVNMMGKSKYKLC